MRDSATRGWFSDLERHHVVTLILGGNRRNHAERLAQIRSEGAVQLRYGKYAYRAHSHRAAAPGR